MDFSDALKTIDEHSELLRSLEEATGKGAGREELSSILANTGVEAGDAEALLAEYQAMRGKAIAVQELDDDQLDMVAGGQTVSEWKNEDSCSDQFQNVCRSNDSFTHKGSEVCSLAQYCDDYFHCTGNSAV